MTSSACRYLSKDSPGNLATVVEGAPHGEHEISHASSLGRRAVAKVVGEGRATRATFTAGVGRPATSGVTTGTGIQSGVPRDAW